MLTALESEVTVLVVAGNNTKQVSKTQIVFIKRHLVQSPTALNNAVKRILGADWHYSYTPDVLQ